MKVDQIRRVPLFSTLTDEEFDRLKHIFVLRAYRKNQIIFLEEETGTYMYLVLSGKVKVSKAGASGKETILAIHRAGDFFGEMSLLDGKTAPATVSAMEDSKIISVSGADFHKYLMHNEKVMLGAKFAKKLRGSLLNGVYAVVNLPEDERRRSARNRALAAEWGLGATHPAEPCRQHEPSFEAPSKVLPRHLRERLIRALEDALAADVNPASGSHLPEHGQSASFEFPEVLPCCPGRHEHRV